DNGRVCKKCGHQVRLHRARSKSPKSVSFDIGKNQLLKPGKSILKGSVAQATTKAPSVRELLVNAIAAATDPKLRDTLQAELSKLEGEQQEPVWEESAAEAVRRADSAWRDAEHKRNQSVKSVMRLRQQLTAAEDKEMAAATALAEATLSKQAAAKRLAQADGVAEAGLINLSWDATIFDNLEDFDKSRMKKKRKSDTPSGAEKEEKKEAKEVCAAAVKAEAERLSRAKFVAAEAMGKGESAK
ncbi:unnamed protein product, partial [Prorocentrum cordatum]